MADGLMPIPTYVVNLPEDRDRLELVTSQLNPADFNVRERSGFLGRTMPDIACLHLTRDPESVRNKGALGVMMSHLWIWERVAHLHDAYAFIIEDDVAFDRPERLITEDLPPDFDLVFCGDQTALNKISDGPGEALGYMTAIQALSVIEQDNMSVGAYGYLLSPAGARRLLALFAADLYFGHVDIRMMAYCCDPDELDRLDYRGGVAQEVRAIGRLIGGGRRLAGYATKSPLVIHWGEESRRAREDLYGSTGAAR
jgi:hypothetical protein